MRDVREVFLYVRDLREVFLYVRDLREVFLYVRDVRGNLKGSSDMKMSTRPEVFYLMERLLESVPQVIMAPT